MISRRVWIALALVACQRHEDPIPTTTTTASATPSTTAAANVTVTPLASIAPMASTSATPPVVHAPMTKEAEAMQLQMLQALGASPSTQGVLKASDLPPVDLSAIAAGARDGGVGDLRLGGGPLRAGGGGGGLGSLGARDH